MKPKRHFSNRNCAFCVTGTVGEPTDAVAALCVTLIFSDRLASRLPGGHDVRGTESVGSNLVEALQAQTIAQGMTATESWYLDFFRGGRFSC